MKIERRFTTYASPVEKQIAWKRVDARVTDGATGEVKFEMLGVEVPEQWSQTAVDIFAQKYLRKAGVPRETARTSMHEIANASQPPGWLLPSIAASNETGAETSAKQVFHRMAGAWTYWGWREGYFFVGDASKQEERARAFYDEIYWMLAHQYAAPNSPQWFSTGLWWAYGIAGPDSGMWATDKDGQAYLTGNSYEKNQPHACFLTPVTDDLVNEGGIMDLWVREARIFKHGSGSGVNISAIRGRGERLSGGGVASGVMSWLEIGDRAAGSIASGGTTRRAAVMRIMDVDHPEIEEFINWKVREETKVAAMDVGSQWLRDTYMLGEETKYPYAPAIPAAALDRMNHGFEPEMLSAYEFEGEAYRTVGGQNANNSVRVTDDFLHHVDNDLPWSLNKRTDGSATKFVKAADLWDKICRAAWASADPGLLFHDTINSWNTCAADGVIRTTNPCSEFHHLDGSACNLASLRLTAFLRPNGTIDLDAYEHACRLWTMVLDISVSMASFPAKEFAIGAYNYRTLGLGYADLGGLLMRLGLPYDSDEGRALAAGLTALMTGVSYRTSAELAEELGPFPRWEANQVPFRAVMLKHRTNITERAMKGWPEIRDRAVICWDKIIDAQSFRNAQTTLIAPTGTISFVMDCAVTGIEPEFALVKHKKLAGGGTLARIINPAVPEALRRLGYDVVSLTYADAMLVEKESLDGFVWRDPAHEAVFDCANPQREGGRYLRPEAHLLMMAAVQPFLSGAISKTVNLPRSATVEDVSRAYKMAHQLGIKAVALYRDGSKMSQPLNVGKEQTPVVQLSAHNDIVAGSSPAGRTIPNGHDPAPLLTRGQRERPPSRRKGDTQKARIGGQTIYWRTGEFPDGRLAEIFVDIAGAGSTLDGLANTLAKMTSIALQFGAPASKIVDALLGVKFDPAGVVELHNRIKMAHSIPDLIARDLAIEYLGDESIAHQPALASGEIVKMPPDKGRGQLGELIAQSLAAYAAMTPEQRAEMDAAQRESFARGNLALDKAEREERMTKRPFGDLCPNCHNATLQRTGTCVKCSNCDWDTGGCG